MTLAPHASLAARLAAPGPKRILSLDGGGVRGTLSLALLARVESLLRARHGRPTLRLCEYFDLIGGTSTGAIIAGCLALGMEVAEVTALYHTHGKRVFARRRMRFWQSLYDVRPLEALLEASFGDVTLGSPDLRTGLVIVTKRADTNSTWPLLNHPSGRFYDVNRDILLRDAVRASAAAPVLFRPARIRTGPGTSGVFVDGAVSMASNPALLLFLVATLSGFPFRWKPGADRMLLTSVGAGRFELEADALSLAEGNALRWLAHLPLMLIQDGANMVELLLQAISRSPTRRTMDAEVGDLSSEPSVVTAVLHYLRYDVGLDAESLAALGASHLIPHVRALRSLTGAEWIPDYASLGLLAAQRDVAPEHFPAAFDLGAAGLTTGVAVESNRG